MIFSDVNSLNKLCYTHDMEGRKFWSDWSYLLNRWGVEELASVLISSAGPFRFVFAQILIVVQPLFKKNPDDGGWSALIELLEDQKESDSFVRFLMKEGHL